MSIIFLSLFCLALLHLMAIMGLTSKINVFTSGDSVSHLFGKADLLKRKTFSHAWRHVWRLVKDGIANKNILFQFWRQACLQPIFSPTLQFLFIST
jgi:hypothetical protein